VPDLTLVREASNGREAIQQFRAHRPDVTLMYLQMPEINGLDAINAIRGEFLGAKLSVRDCRECKRAAFRFDRCFRPAMPFGGPAQLLLQASIHAMQ
jgi:DNA-binding NarL/FixJ family response regulator